MNNHAVTTAAAAPAKEVNLEASIDSTGRFTTEIFKLEIKNLNHFLGVAQVKKRFASLDVCPVKVKVLREVTFVTFRSAAERDAALLKLQGHRWKGNELKVRLSQPVADPCLLKRKQAEALDDIDDNSGMAAKKNKQQDQQQDQQDPVEKLRNAVTPYWNVPYEQQLKRKVRRVRTCLEGLHQSLCSLQQETVTRLPRAALFVDSQSIEPLKAETATLDSIESTESAEPLEPIESTESAEPLEPIKSLESMDAAAALHPKRLMICPLEPIVRAPADARACYRNKCELTIGWDASGTRDRLLGFRLGAYRDAQLAVGAPAPVQVLPAAALAAVAELQRFLDAPLAAGGGADLASYDPTRHAGHWRGAVVRCSREDDVMLTVELQRQALNDAELAALQTRLCQWFAAGAGGLTSLLWTVHAPAATATSLAASGGAAPELLWGKAHLTERFAELTWRVSPLAFFQVNTRAAEALVGAVRAFVGDAGADTVLLDVCCGTGVLGLALATHVQQLIGFELCADAVADAHANAVRNGINNARFVAGRAEVELPRALAALPDDASIVALLDPPRPGVHTSLVHLLRRCAAVKRIVYVACDPTVAARKNLLDLGRPQSKRFRGAPFLPVRARPLDLFPQTPHVELVLLLERE